MSIVRYVEPRADDDAARSVHARVMAILGQRGAMTFPLRVGQLDCGDGKACRVWAERGHEVFGVDESHALIMLARRHARDDGLEVNFEVASTMALPWPDASLDLCLNDGTPEPEYWRDTGLDEMVRVLKPGGVLYFTRADPDTERRLRARGLLVLDRYDLARRAARTVLARTGWTVMGAMARLGVLCTMRLRSGALLAFKTGQ